MNRLSLRTALESETPAPAPAAQHEVLVSSPIALEGLFDGLKQLFTHDPVKKTNKQRNPDHSWLVSAQRWSRVFHDVISKTYANPEWVKEHLIENQPHSVQRSQRLSYQGKHLATPERMLRQAEKIRDEWFNQHRDALKKYGRELEELHADIEEKHTLGFEGHALYLYGILQAASIRPPFGKGDEGPEFFGGRYPVFGRQRPMSKPLPTTASKKLPQLTVSMIVDAAHTMLEISGAATTQIEKFLSQTGAAGIDCSDDDFWAELETDPYIHESEMLKAVFEEHPDEQCRMVMFYAHGVFELCADIGRWFYSVTPVKSEQK